MTHAIDATDATLDSPDNVVALSRWLSPSEAAEALGLSIRALQYRAKRGDIERRKEGRRTFYRVEGRTQSAVAPMRQSERTHATKDARNAKDATATAELRALLAAEQTARIDAERRAAVAEYQLKNVTSDLETMTAERDLARAQGQRLADAMRKRHGLIKRLTAKLATR